jgi:hypothetical protein
LCINASKHLFSVSSLPLSLFRSLSHFHSFSSVSSHLYFSPSFILLSVSFCYLYIFFSYILSVSTYLRTFTFPAFYGTRRFIIVFTKPATSWVSPCGICGGESGTGPVFPRALRFSSVSFISPVLHYTEKPEKN